MEKEKQWLTPEQQELRRRIEKHPLLTLPPEQRVGQTAQRMELLMLIMRLKKFDRKLERRNQSQDLAILADEQELHDSRVSCISRLAGKYDSVAFMSTIDKALLGYDASQGTPFLAYFDRIYVHELHRAANREDAINHQGRVALTSREGHLIKEMQRLSKVLGYHLKDLPHRYDEELARSLDLTPAQLRDLMEKADAVERFVSMDQMADSEDDSTPAMQISDPHGGDAQTQLENLAEILRAVQMFADLDCQEYPRLFFTNDVLRPLKEEDGPISPDAYCRVLLRIQKSLWDQIFVHGYIEFTFAPPPAPDCIEHLLDARLSRPLQDASIAAYKKVSAAAVSYQRKRYTKAQQTWFRENDFSH